jgi:hypothetical protein
MKKKVLVMSSFVIVLGVMSFDIMHKSGFSGYTKSPGEFDCSSCHTGSAVNAAGGSIAITSSPFFTSSKYIPGQTYAVSVTIARTTYNLYGFGFEALKADGSNAGTFTITNPSEMQIDTAVVNGKNRANVIHVLSGGASANTHTFTFNWKAPASGTGAVTLYTAGVAANNSNSNGGDYVYRVSKALTEDTSIGVGVIERSNSTGDFTIYPNPMTESTTLSYNLKENGTISAKLMTINGKIVSKFFEEEQTAGQHEHKVNIDPSLSKGIYFISFEVDGEQNLQKVIIK